MHPTRRKAVGIGLLVGGLGALAWAAPEMRLPDLLRPAAPRTPPYIEPGAIHVLNERGEPFPGVRLFEAGEDRSASPPRWEAGRLGVSDERGIGPASGYPVVLGIATDGRLAIQPAARSRERSDPPNRLTFGPTATLRIRFRDPRGRPVSGRAVCLLPVAQDGGPLRVGASRRAAPGYDPALAARLRAVTDARGEATFPGLPADVPQTVLLAAGKNHFFSLDGTARPGTPVEVVLPDFPRISGRVTDADSGRPLPGVRIALWTEYDRWHQELQIPAQAATTDAQGRYRFEDVPDRSVSVGVMELSKAFGRRAYVETRQRGEGWRDQGWMEWPKREVADVVRETHTTGTPIEMKGDERVDLRILNFARLEVTSDAPYGISLAFSDALPGEGSGNGKGFRKGRAWHDEPYPAFLLRPGTHRMTVRAFASARGFDAGAITVRAGEDRRIRVPIPQRREFLRPPKGASEQRDGPKIWEFRAMGSDGRRYDEESLARRGPVLLFNLDDEEALPKGVNWLNRLDRLVRGRVLVAGYVSRNAVETRALVRRHRVRFLLFRPERYDTGLDIGTLFVDDRSVTYLANGLLLPNGWFSHVWLGFNRHTLRQMALDYQTETGRPLGVDFSGFPDKVVSEPTGLIGLGGG